MKPNIKIGCEAYIIRDGKLLLGKRGNVYGSGTWALPGGHLELMERADECIVRELKEEMGLTVDAAQITLLALSDDLQPENNIHYLHITFSVDIGSEEPEILEPEACQEWRWFPVDSIPENIFPPHVKIFDTVRSKNTYTPKTTERR